MCVDQKCFGSLVAVMFQCLQTKLILKRDVQKRDSGAVVDLRTATGLMKSFWDSSNMERHCIIFN